MNARLPEHLKRPHLNRYGIALFAISVALLLLLVLMRIEDRWAEETAQKAATQTRTQLELSAKKVSRSFAPTRPLISVEAGTLPPTTANAVFHAEYPMYEWANPKGDWLQVQRVYTGPTVTYFRHRMSFPGDVEFRLEPQIQRSDLFQVSLVIADNAATKQEGYLFRYRCDPDLNGGSPRSRVELLRAGETVASQDFFEPPHQLSLRRCGSYIVGSVNWRTVLTYRDEQPLTGSQIAYITQGATVPFNTVRVECPNVRDEFFFSAPVDWRTAGSAIAEISARWQCDSRWTFYSLQNDRSAGKNAVLWNKRKYAGDVRMEMFVATRQAGERGMPYMYTRDINVSLCPDSSDLTKGYTFLWGGFGNRYSAILRNGVEVARMEKKIPTDLNFGRHWFYYRVERRGNRLSFCVDLFFRDDTNESKRTEMIYEDPDPLPCTRLAIWTYDNTIAISRVRIVGESKPGENPGAPIPPMKFLIEEPASQKVE